MVSFCFLLGPVWALNKAVDDRFHSHLYIFFPYNDNDFPVYIIV